MPTVENRNGIWWMDAPKPRRWHRCKPWTIGREPGRVETWRCACGRMGWPDLGWADNKNERR